MSLSVASSIALSALRAAEVGISVTSANIANADVDGYTVKSVSQTSTIAGGIGTGTAVTEVTGGVNQYIFRAYLTANSDLGAATTTADYTDRLQALLGSVTDGTDSSTSFADDLSDLETAVSELGSDPDSTTSRTEIVEAATSAAASLRELSSSIQSLRQDADGEIADDVETVNDLLGTIDDLNDAIITASITGQSTADLTDKLDSALTSLSDLMDIKTVTKSSGAVYVYTSSGTPLVNGTVHELSYSPASTVTSQSTFMGITVDGTDITDDITSGAISSLVTLRDDTLVEAQDELDNLASALIASVNDVLADGSAVPAPDSLTASVSSTASDAFSATGSVRIALVDDDGDLISSTDLDLSSYSTISDLVSALDAIDGIDASLDADGQLTISSTNGSDGVAIGAMDSAVGSDGVSFSSYFGFNALFTGSSASDIAVSSDIVSDPSLLATGTLSTSSSTAGDAVLTTGSTTVADALADALTGDTSFSAAGGIAATATSFVDYASLIIGDYADRASDAEDSETTADAIASSLSDTISSQSGVNVDEETAKLSDYQSLYEAAAQVMQIANEMFSTLLEVVQSS